MDASPVIRIAGVRKSFKRHEVLKGVDLEVPAGSIFGFLGLNGAGKTTLIRTLLGLLKADGGTCNVASVDPSRNALEVRRRIGYMAENQTMYGWMRVGQIIDWVGRFYPSWDAALAESLRQQMKLDSHQKVGVLSKGQSSRLALLLALAHRPRLVILDDPTLGLDPVARRDFLRNVIGYLQAEGVTVFFSSHMLYEIEPICDRVAILHEGRIVRTSPVDELRESVKRVTLKPVEGMHIEAIPGVLDVQKEGDHLAVTVESFELAQPALAGASRNGLAIADLNLDEIFEAYVIGRRQLATEN